MAVSDEIDAILRNAPPSTAAPSTPEGAPSTPLAAPMGAMTSDIDAALAGKLPPSTISPDQHLTQAYRTGLESAAIAGTLGFPVDAATAVLNAPSAAINLTGRALGYEPNMPYIQHPVGGEETFNWLLGKVGMGTESYTPTTDLERYAQAAGYGTGTVISPNVFGKARLATKLVGEGAKFIPAGRDIDEMLAPETAATRPTPPPEPPPPGAPPPPPGPISQAVQATKQAGRDFVSGLPSPGAAVTGAASGITGEAGHDIAPEGWQETGRVAGQLVGGLPIAAATAAVPTAVRAGWEAMPTLRSTARTAAATEMAQQQYARSGASLERLAGTGTPDETRAHIQALLDENDRLRAVDQGTAEQQATAARERVEPQMTAEQQGQAAAQAMHAAQAPARADLERAHQETRQALDETAAHLGGAEAMGTPEEQATAPGAYGARMRDPAQLAYNNERRRLQAIVNAMPKGMGVSANPIKNAVTEIGQKFAKDTFSGDENGFYGRINGWGDQIPFEDAVGLRADINDRLSRTLDHRPREQLRLMQLKNAVDESLTTPMEPSAPPPDPIAEQDLANARRWAAQRLGIPEPDVTPEGLRPLTPEFQQKFADFNRQWAEMEHQYQGETAGTRHAVGEMLQRGGAYDSYKLRDDEVPWILVGPKGSPEAIDRFLAATADHPDAAAALSDAFAFSLRRAAQRPDGTFDSAALQRWKRTNQDKVTRVPGLLDKINTVGGAQAEVDRIQQVLTQHDADFPLRPGLNHADVLKQYWKPGAEGEAAMRRYVAETGNDPAARTAAIDYAAYQYMNTRGMIKNGVIDPTVSDRWLAQHGGKLDVLGARDMFADAGAAQRTVQQVIDRHLERRAQIANNAATFFLQDDPYKAMSRVFTGNAPGIENARHLMEITKDNPLAQEGVQRAAINYMRKEFEADPEGKAEYGQLKPRFDQFVEQNRGTLEVLFPGTARVFDDIVAHHRATGQTAFGGWSPWVAGTLGGIAAETLGGFAAEQLPHLAGHLITPAAGVVTGIGYRMLQQWSARNIKMQSEEIFNNILKNPALADAALRANRARGTMGANIISRQFYARALALAIQASHGDDLLPRKDDGPRKSLVDYGGGRARGGRVRVDRQPPSGPFWRGGAIIPQAVPPRYH